MTNNRALNGGIYVYSGSVSISNSTLANNSADGDGGAIGVFEGNVSISNSMLTNNNAENVGGAIKVFSNRVLRQSNVSVT